jgi:uncharacterized protein with PIN domain
MSGPPRFFCDDHLRRLARWLRAAGYDAAWERAIGDATLLARCTDEGRILLTLDRALADRAGPAACLLPSHDPPEQLRFVARRYGLDLLARAFTRCPVCNEPLLEAAAADVEVPARVREACDRFWRCATCGRAYWEGDHVRNMRARFRAAEPNRG